MTDELTIRQRDFVLLTIFVMLQQGYMQRAGILAEALSALGDGGTELLLSRAVLRFLAEEWAAALALLEELDRVAPIERFGDYQMDERQRMRRYLRARCLFELGDEVRSREALDSYMRHGKTIGDELG
jgi:hypothetical protein